MEIISRSSKNTSMSEWINRSSVFIDRTQAALMHKEAYMKIMNVQ